VADETITDDRSTKDRATDVATIARDEARGVAGDAGSEAAAVVSEAGAQARAVADDARTTLRRQASEGTSRAAGAIDQLAGRLHALADGEVDQAGDLRRQAHDLGDRLGGMAGRMQQRGLDGLVDDVQDFARRRPALFLAAAAGAGFAAGRLFRGAKADAEAADSSGNGYGAGPGVTGPGVTGSGRPGSVSGRGAVGGATTALPPAGAPPELDEQQRAAELSGFDLPGEPGEPGARGAAPEGPDGTTSAPTSYGETGRGTTGGQR
jgi:hypothetical protein